MYNCFNCKFAKEKYESTEEDQMIFYCEKAEKILIVYNLPEYTCDEYEPNLHDHCAAPDRS